MRLTFVVVAIACTGCAGLRLGAGGLLGAPSAERFESSHRAPYPTTVSYFGYFAPDAKPDTPEGAPPRFYLYVWLPNAAPELGVRVVSPTFKWAQPTDGDTRDPGYEEHVSDPAHFDPMVTLERCVDGLNPADLLEPCPRWALLGESDDAAEGVPAQADGAKVNALLRAKSEPDEALKAVVRGLYRVGVWAAKGTSPTGTFWIQLGADRDLGADILVARTPEALEPKIP